MDVQRFSMDSEYKKETILGLTMTTNDEMYNVACNLANRYDIALWELYMSHLEFLFESGLAIEEVEERVTLKNIIPTLVTQPQEFVQRMKTYVYPNLVGTDHMTLIYYFTLLTGLGEVDHGGISAESHLKLLKKIKGVAEGLDYKKLMEGRNPARYIVPVLTQNNITSIAKLANKIPDGSGGFLHSSVVYCAWTIRQFWSSEGKKVPDTTAAWVHRYESCGDSLNKLLPSDVIKFIDEVVFTEQGRNKLEVDCRQEIVRRCLKYTKQQGGKKKKMEDAGSSISWEDAAKILQGYLSHIEALNHENFLSLKMSGDPVLVEFAARLDLSKGDKTVLQSLFCEMIEAGYTVELVEDMMEVITVSPWTPKTAVQEAVGHMIESLRESSSSKEKDVLPKLERIVLNVEEHQNQGGELVTSEDMMILLRPFCSDDTVAVKPRLDVLHIVEKSFKLSEEDLVLLTLYRTEAVVKATWSDTQLKQSDISTDQSRQDLLSRLLKQSSEFKHYKSLCDLMQLWPPLKAASSSVPADNVWVMLFCAMVAAGDDKTVSLVVSTYKTFCNQGLLHQKCIETVYEKMIDQNYSAQGIKLVLLSGCKDLFPILVTELARHQQVNEDEDLFSLLLINNFVPDIISTVYYQPVIGYLLANQTVDESCDHVSVEKVANQLNDKGFKAEAGSLLLQSRSTHSVLQTFGSALGSIGKWLKR